MLAKILVTLDLPTPLYYCTGDPIIQSGHHFLTRSMKAPKIALAQPSSNGWHILIHDQDWTLHDDLEANPSDWENFEVSFQKVTRVMGENAYSVLNLVTMTFTEPTQNMEDRWMKLSLSAVVGLNKKRCLTEGSRTNFSMAPSPDDTIQHGSRQVRFSSGSRRRAEPPAGKQPRMPSSQQTRGNTVTSPGNADVPLDDAIGVQTDETGVSGS